MESLVFGAEAAAETTGYSYNAEEKLYLAGVEATLEGNSYTMHDIDGDEISELFVLDKKKGSVDVYSCEESADKPKLLGSIEGASEVSVRESEPGFTAAPNDGERREYTIVNGELKEQTPEEGEWKTVHWVDPDQWADGSIIGVASLTGDPGPQNDYYLSSNFEWLSEEHVKAAGDICSGTDNLDQNVQDNKEAMLKDRDKYQGEDIKRVRDYYDAATNWEKRNADGIEPVSKYLDAVENVSTMDEFAEYLVNPEINPFCHMLGITITLDEKDTSHWAAELAEDTFSVLPRIYHNESREDIEEVRSDFDAKAKYILGRAGYPDEKTKKILDECYKVEDELLPAAWPAEDDEKDALYGFKPYEDVTGAAESFPLERLLNAYGIEEGMIHVYYPGYLRKLDELWKEENLSMLKSYALAHTAAEACDYLDLAACRCLEKEDVPEADAIDSLNDQYKTEVLSARGPVGVAEENAYMSFFADPEIRKDVTALAEEIRDTFREILENEQWMSEEGKAAAVGKLDNMTFSVMAPDTPIDSSYLSIDLFSR